MESIKLSEATHQQREQAAELLIAAFRHAPTSWRDLKAALDEVNGLLGPGRVAFVMVESGNTVGLIGAIKHSESQWELHPLAVHPDYQRKGIGTGLVRILEAEARQEGITMIWLGTDDDFGGTNIFGVDLYPDVLEHMMELRSTKGHPYTFYQKLGYAVVGVIPDAGGPGMHDILMAKRICSGI